MFDCQKEEPLSHSIRLLEGHWLVRKVVEGEMTR